MIRERYPTGKIIAASTTIPIYTEMRTFLIECLARGSEIEQLYEHINMCPLG